MCGALIYSTIALTCSTIALTCSTIALIWVEVLEIRL